MNMLAGKIVSGLFGALLVFGQSASAAPVTPNFDTWGDLTALDGGAVTFGGSGIPTDPAAISTFDVGNDTIRVGIIATPRFSSPALTNDGNGTYTAQSGEGAPGRSTWNFSFYAESSGELADAGLKLYYDLDPTSGNNLSTMGVYDISAIMPFESNPSVFEGSENLTFGFLAAGVPGFIAAPSPNTGVFDPFVAGEYSFRIGVDGDDTGQYAAINVNVAAVPLPAGLPLMLTALGGLFWMRRRAA